MLTNIDADPYKIDERMQFHTEEQLQEIEHCLAILRAYNIFPKEDSEDFEIGSIVAYTQYVEEAIAVRRLRIAAEKEKKEAN